MKASVYSWCILYRNRVVSIPAYHVTSLNGERSDICILLAMVACAC